KTVEAPLPLDQKIANAFVLRTAERGPAKVAMRVRRIHAQLTHGVAPLREQTEPGRALDGEPILWSVWFETVQEPARDEDVVERLEREIAERCLQRSSAFDDEDEIVAVAVGEVDGIRRVGKRHA